MENTSKYRGEENHLHSVRSIKPVFLYTMTAGLGDIVVMGSLARSVEAAVPGAEVLFLHRNNPHTALWGGETSPERFYSVYSAGELRKLAARLLKCRRTGSTIFGLQMAPGSLQGFLLFSLLKKLGMLDYVVDFNLINADIITPPRGDYILDLHLNQIAELTRIPLPMEQFRLSLPERLSPAEIKRQKSGMSIGIHPWSRRGHLESFVWQKEKWLELVQLLLQRPDVTIVVFGRDDGFDAFSSWLRAELGADAENVVCTFTTDVAHLVDTISDLDMLISVNTAVVHIGYALAKPMVILCGPSLDIWIPKGDTIRSIRDSSAQFQASDTWIDDGNFGSIQRIQVERVAAACRELVGTPR